MAGGLDEENDGVIASINMVPFIDISLVLLIIFLVTSSYIVRQAIEVDLPQAASGEEVAPSTLAVTVQRNGNLAFNGEQISFESLDDAIRREVESDSEVQAIIAADRGVDYGVVMDVIDEVKSNGVKSFALNIDREVEGE
jgi:biopolymer transport protein ExbD